MKRLNLLRSTTAVLVTALLFGIVALVMPSYADTGGIGGRPANPDPNNPRTQSIFVYTLDKGQSKEDQVVVSNNTSQAQTINLYAVDGIVTNTGSYTCKQQAEVSDDLGSWITLASEQVTLVAHENKKISFTVNVPETADVGEHDACIVFQSAEDQGQVEGNVVIHTRQAIRVVETIPGKLNRDIEITTFNTTRKNGLQQFTLDVSNQGNVSADTNAIVELKNLFGGVSYHNGGGYPVIANTKLSLNFVDDKQPFFGGWYRAQATVSYDSRAGVFGTTSTKNLITRQSRVITVFIVPNPIAILLYVIIVVIVGGIAAWYLIRKKQKTNALISWQEVKIKHGDTINDYAVEYGVSWKKIASVNSIHAPYTLKAGEMIKLPTDKKPASSKTSKES